ncbi:hypothetical protein EZJ19_11520 [Parasulfuritortus cantonensis]|uniref:Uncharacterized protein n=1 Tax=Parasulfuritortus cantonensis TaxID=2528202 RepID=A0A4R1B5Q8_9PROT|nr:hypothetical protein [Parasulfuritortus cantonensis]TCJ12860.1 hypothetical protein EZJ19_11520 [Parasulfuritortus cantonensis]
MARIPPLVVLFCLGFWPAWATAAESAPSGTEAWLTRMLEGARAEIAPKGPMAVAEWLDSVTEPRAMTALATAAGPAPTAHRLAAAVTPQVAVNGAELNDPRLFLHRLLAAVLPPIRQAIDVTRPAAPGGAGWATFHGVQEEPGHAPVVDEVVDPGWCELPPARLSRARFRY